MSKKIKTVALYSGGLDSLLAMLVMKRLGVEVIALNFRSAFCNAENTPNKNLRPSILLEKLGIELVTKEFTKNMIPILKSPKFGFGKHANPCIDCHIFMIKEAGKYMKEIGADFIITGEVVGQRPKSQRFEAIMDINDETGLDGLIVRPLCAKCLPPTKPEKEGLIDREKLYAINGRSRKKQIELANEFGLEEFPGAAGGCLLTDKSYGLRVKDMLENQSGTFSEEDFYLLKIGRHFRLDKDTKAIVARNAEECNQLTDLSIDGDILFEIDNAIGPVTLLRGKIKDESIQLAGGLTIYFSKQKGNNTITILSRKQKSNEEYKFQADSVSDEFIKEKAIGRI